VTGSSPWRLEAALRQRAEAGRTAYDSAATAADAFRAAVRYALSIVSLVAREVTDSDDALKKAAEAVWAAAEMLAGCLEAHIADRKNAKGGTS
jgi:hypothetical protein